MPNIVDIDVRSTDSTKPVMDKVEAEFKASGQRAADNFTRDANGRLHDNLGRFAAEGEELGRGIGDGIGKGISPGLDDFDKKVQDKTKQTAKNASSGMSPLLLSAFTGAATLGPAALIAGAGVAVAGIAALVARSNAGIQSEYQTLGQDVSSTLTAAVAPFAADIQKSVSILDQGLSTVGPELKDVFSAAAPYSEDIARSLVSIVQQSLPGFTAGLHEIQPIMQVLSTVTGDIGKGVGDFAQALGTGSSGAATGLSALGTALEHILPDVGQIAGSLSNGLGPALKDILTVATPVVDALAKFVSVIPPGVIETAAVATAALFTAFKLGTIAGVVTEGTSFVGFLKGLIPVEVAATAETDALATSSKGLGLSLAGSLGPLGLIIGGAGLLGDYLGHLAGVGDHTSVNMDQLTQSLQAASQGSTSAQQGITLLAEQMGAMMQIVHKTPDAVNQLDQALTQLQSTNSSAAASQYNAIAAAWEKQGMSADDVAKKLPLYTQAVTLSSQVAISAAQAQDSLTTALQAAAGTAGTSAQQNAVNTLATLGLTDGTDGLTTSMYNTLQAFTLNTGAANAYNSVLQALNGTQASLDNAQNAMAQDLINLTADFKRNGDSIDLNTQAGVSNRQALSGAAQAAVQMATAQYQANGNMTQANQTLKQQEQNILNSTGATGKARSAIQAYLDEIMQIPKNVTTNVGADTTQAYGQVYRFIQSTNASAAYVQVYATNGGAGGRQLLAHGGAVGASHAAEGGPRGNIVTVGEHGIEDVQLPVGSTVFSHEDTMTRRQGSGGTTKIVLEWVGPSGDDWLFKAIREGVRARAGADPESVQKVLGGNF